LVQDHVGSRRLMGNRNTCTCLSQFRQVVQATMARRKRKLQVWYPAIGPELVIRPTSEHTHTVIMLHGSYYDGKEFDDLASLVKKEAERHGVSGSAGIKYIFPNSPLNEYGENFWYDYLANDDDEAPEMQCDNDLISIEQWEAQTQRIADIVATEVQALGDARRVILGGNSAGGTVAIHVALHHCAEPLGALLCLRTCPMRHTLGPAPPVPVTGEPDGSMLSTCKTIGIPVFVYQAGKDDTYVPALQARNYGFIETAGFSVWTKVKPNGKHDEDDPEENPQVAEWIVSIFFKGDQTSGT